MSYTKYIVSIDGMMCGMCEAHIKEAVRKQFPNADKVTASAQNNEASFIMEGKMPAPMIKHELHTAVDLLGYKILSVKTEEAEVQKGFLKGLFGGKK